MKSPPLSMLMFGIVPIGQVTMSVMEYRSCAVRWSRLYIPYIWAEYTVFPERGLYAANPIV